MNWMHGSWVTSCTKWKWTNSRSSARKLNWYLDQHRFICADFIGFPKPMLETYRQAVVDDILGTDLATLVADHLEKMSPGQQRLTRL